MYCGIHACLIPSNLQQFVLFLLLLLSVSPSLLRVFAFTRQMEGSSPTTVKGRSTITPSTCTICRAQIYKFEQQGSWKQTGRKGNSKGSEWECSHWIQEYGGGQGSLIVFNKTILSHLCLSLRGENINWVMHEYQLVDEEFPQDGVNQACLNFHCFTNLGNLEYLFAREFDYCFFAFFTSISFE